MTGSRRRRPGRRRRGLGEALWEAFGVVVDMTVGRFLKWPD